jgi:hypothetical protein
MKVVRSTLRTVDFNPQDIPDTRFSLRLSQPQDHSAAERIMSMKNNNNPIGNRTLLGKALFKVNEKSLLYMLVPSEG